MASLPYSDFYQGTPFCIGHSLELGRLTTLLERIAEVLKSNPAVAAKVCRLLNEFSRFPGLITLHDGSKKSILEKIVSCTLRAVEYCTIFVILLPALRNISEEELSGIKQIREALREELKFSSVTIKLVGNLLNLMLGLARSLKTTSNCGIKLIVFRIPSMRLPNYMMWSTHELKSRQLQHFPQLMSLKERRSCFQVKIKLGSSPQ